MSRNSYQKCRARHDCFTWLNSGSYIVLKQVKGKGKVHPRTGHEGPEGE